MTDDDLETQTTTLTPITDTLEPTVREQKYEDLKRQLEEQLNKGKLPVIGRYVLACLSAAPYIGGGIGGLASIWSEQEQNRINDIFAMWMSLHDDELKEIGKTLFEVMIRIDKEDENVRKRIESPEYLSLIKKAFRDWAAAESEEKRILIRNLLVNAASPSQLSSDDLIRLFIRWIDVYDEAHFKIIKVVYNHSGVTRNDIWQAINGTQVRENSADADLFKYLIDDLSQGRLIRQHRPVDSMGNFIRVTNPKKTRVIKPRTYTSAFDDDKQYELTELGEQFVHYVMTDVVTKIGDGRSNANVA